MPVLAGGMVDAEAATRWVERNVDGTVRQARQRQVHGRLPPAMRETIEAMDELQRLVVYWTAQRIPGLAATLAVEGGLSVEGTRQMHDLALIGAANLAEDVRNGMPNLPPGGLGLLREVTPFPPVDWPALAVSRAAASP